MICPYCTRSIKVTRSRTVICGCGQRLEIAKNSGRKPYISNHIRLRQCSHFGAMLRYEENCNCVGGAKVEVHECAIHGQCALHSISTSKKYGLDRQRIKAVKWCLACSDFAPCGSFNLSGGNIWRLFEQTPRVKLPDDCVIVTAATPDFWPYLQLLTLSLALSHDVKRLCVDLGLSEEQRAWLVEHGVDLLPKPNLIIPETIKAWGTWNKPLYIQQASQFAPHVLWIDSDAMVMRSLAPMVELLYKQPVFIHEGITDRLDPKRWKSIMLNGDNLYKNVKVLQRVTNLRILNAGVLGLSLPRDAEILEVWAGTIRLAARDEAIRNSLRWWDQGALIYTLEKLGKLNLINDRKREWNDTTSMQHIHTLRTMSERVRSVNPSTIFHFAGADNKPMNEDPQATIGEHEEAPLPLKVFVLGHCEEQFENIAQKHYLEFVRLDEIPEAEFIHPQMAEFRFYFTDYLEQSSEEYLGCASASWNSKYRQHKIDQLWHLKLSPNVVWCAAKATVNWPRETYKEHPGFEPLLDLLCKISGVTLGRESLWANNYLAHRTVTLDCQQFFRHVFAEFHRHMNPRGGWSKLPFNGHDPARQYAYVCERIVMLYFSSRTDLEIRQI